MGPEYWDRYEYGRDGGVIATRPGSLVAWNVVPMSYLSQGDLPTTSWCTPPRSRG